MGLIAWVVVGGIAGWLASMMMGSDGRQGCLMDIVLGIVGGLVGGFLLNFLGFGGQLSGINIPTIFTAFFGAVVLLFLKKKLL